MATKEFLYGAIHAPSGSKMLNINTEWLKRPLAHGTVISLNQSMIRGPQSYEVHSDNPVVISFYPSRINSIID